MKFPLFFFIFIALFAISSNMIKTKIAGVFHCLELGTVNPFHVFLVFFYFYDITINRNSRMILNTIPNLNHAKDSLKLSSSRLIFFNVFDKLLKYFKRKYFHSCLQKQWQLSKFLTSFTWLELFLTFSQEWFNLKQDLLLNFHNFSKIFIVPLIKKGQKIPQNHVPKKGS